MVGRTEGANEFRLGSRLHPIENMNVQPALHSEQRRKQPDWTCTSHQDMARFPERTPADRADLFPGLGDDRGGLKQDAQYPEGAVHFDRVLRLDPPVL